MREIVTLGVGQCGNQVSAKLWEELAWEHGIGKDGKSSPDVSEERLWGRSVFFNEKRGGKFVPRAILLDLRTSRLLGNFI